ncbi:hypothetical protein CerSpe_114660 [Prunus speciosa]
MTVGDSWIHSYKCQQAESINGATTEDENGTWFVDSAKELNTINNMGAATEQGRLPDQKDQVLYPVDNRNVSVIE